MLRSADFATSVLAEMLERQPMSPGKVQFAWRAAVGPAVARVSTVEWRDGKVVARMASPQWQREVERSRAMILERLRMLLGRGVVKGFEVVCGSAGL